MTTPESVFISYSRRDKGFVERLSADLRARGVTPWIDVENILPGSNWQTSLVDAVGAASAFIYVISAASLKSVFMAYELSHPAARGKPVFPVIIEDVNLGDLPPAVADLQWADFRVSYEVGLSRLLDGLGNELRGSGKPVSRRPSKSKGYAFLSYAEEDEDFVVELKGFLRDKGYAFWDYQESDRDYHSQWFLEVEGIITEAVATLSVLSEAWKRSKWTVREFFFSDEIGTPVFLLRAKHMGPTLVVAGLNYVDFTIDKVAGFNKLDRELVRKRL